MWAEDAAQGKSICFTYLLLSLVSSTHTCTHTGTHQPHTHQPHGMEDSKKNMKDTSCSFLSQKDCAYWCVQPTPDTATFCHPHPPGTSNHTTQPSSVSSASHALSLTPIQAQLTTWLTSPASSLCPTCLLHPPQDLFGVVIYWLCPLRAIFASNPPVLLRPTLV